MKLTGVAILVSRGIKVLQAAPAAELCRSAAIAVAMTEAPMGKKQEINEGCISIILVTAGIIGLSYQSFGAGAIAFVALCRCGEHPRGVRGSRPLQVESRGWL